MNLFNLKILHEPTERTYGIALRLFGIDLAVVFTGFVDLWYLLYVKAFGNGITGFYIQVLGLVLILGIKADILFGVDVEQSN